MRLLPLLVIMTALSATDFHLSTAGDDQADGRSAATAWASWDRLCRHVTEHGLAPGDRILLRAGDRFAATRSLELRLDRCHGSAQQPVVITGAGGPATIAASACHAILLWAEDATDGSIGGHITLADLVLEGDGVPKPDGGNTDGILIWNSSRTPVPGLRIERVTMRGFAGNGIETGRGSDAGRLQDLAVIDCVAEDNPGAAGVAPHSGSGIVIGGGERVVIERCRAARNGARNDNPGGPIGIWLWDSIDSVIRDCVSHENLSIHGDGGGFDLDGACQRCVIERCLSFGNVGAGYLLAQFQGAHQRGPLVDNVIRYCVSVDDGRQDGYGGITLWGAGGDDVVGATEIHHCTVIMTTPPAKRAACVRVWPGAAPQDVVLHSNLFITADDLPLFESSIPLESSHLRFDHNAWLVADGTDWHMLLTDQRSEDLASWLAHGLASDDHAGTAPWPLPIPVEALRLDPAQLSTLELLRPAAASELDALGRPVEQPTSDLGGRPVAAGARFVGALAP